MCVGAVFFEIPSSTEEYSFHILDVYNQLNPRTCQAGMILLVSICTATSHIRSLSLAVAFAMEVTCRALQTSDGWSF